MKKNNKPNKPNFVTITLFVFLAMFWIDFLLSALKSSLASSNSVSASSVEEEVIEEETEETEQTNIGGQCFITENKWYEGASTYRVVYAIDTKVKYLVITGRYGSSVTPLYNADGTLQVFTEQN